LWVSSKYDGDGLETILGFVAMAALIVGNGIFVAGEFALVAADRGRIDLAAQAGSRRAVLVRSMFGRLGLYLSGAQLGVTMTSIVLGFLAEPLVATALRGPLHHVLSEKLSERMAVGLALVIAAVVQLIAAELVPKNVAVARAEGTAITLAPFLRVFVLVFRPIIATFRAASEWTLRRLGIESRSELESVPTLDDLDVLIRASGHKGMLDPESARLLTRSIRFADKSAAEIIIPRLDIVALPDTASAADLAHLVASHRYSRYPVYHGELDDVVGVVLAKDLLRIASAERSQVPVSAFMRPILAVPEAQPLGMLLVEMRKKRRQLAVVIDEYGGTAGILTLEDILEEIVGEIDDEYDDEPALTSAARSVGTGFVLDGDLDRDRVAEESGIDLPDGDYETLAGFALIVFDRIPAVGDTEPWQGWVLEIIEMERHRITRIAFRPAEAQP
jgi:CBS domain containing-hemolysin-like protein